MCSVNSANSMTKIFVIKRIQTCHLLLTDQATTAAPARHMWETGYLNWVQFMHQWFIRLPEFTEITEFNETSTPIRENSTTTSEWLGHFLYEKAFLDTSNFGATVSDFWWCFLWVSKQEGAALFTLGGNIHDIPSLRFTSSATPLLVYMTSIAAIHLPLMCVSAEVGCRIWIVVRRTNHSATATRQKSKTSQYRNRGTQWSCFVFCYSTVKWTQLYYFLAYILSILLYICQ